MKIRKWGIAAAAILAVSAAYAESTAGKVSTRAEDVEPLAVGDKVPALVLKDADGKDFDLNKSIADKPAALIFFRGGW